MTNFSFRVADASGFSVRDVSLPQGTLKDDPEFGPVQVIYGQVEIPVRVNRPAGPVTTISLEAGFQGCRDGDICYPPQSRTVSFELPAAAGPMGEPAATISARIPPGTVPGQALPPVSEQDRLAPTLRPTA